MLIKAFKLLHTEIIVMRDQESRTYTCLRLSGNSSIYKPDLTYEEADDMFNYLIDELLGVTWEGQDDEQF